MDKAVMGNRHSAMRAVAVCFVMLSVTTAWANAGTPLLMLAFLHLTIGNFVLGAAEGLLIAWLFKRSLLPCILWMIVGNFASAVVGLSITEWVSGGSRPRDYASTVSATLWPKIVALYFATLVIEWPFVAACFRKSPSWLSQSVKSTLLVQSVSYAVLFGAYWAVSDRSMMTDFTHLPAGEISMPADVAVYFISAKDGHVYRREGDGQAELVMALGSTERGDSLQLDEVSSAAETLDLVANMRDRRLPKTLVVAGITTATDSFVNRFTGYQWGYDGAPRVGSAKDSPWRFRWSAWSTQGLSGKNRGTSETLRMAYGWPLGSLPVWRVAHLPEEKLLIQLNETDLVLLDIATRSLSPWEKGYGAVAVMTNEELSSATVGGPVTWRGENAFSMDE